MTTYSTDEPDPNAYDTRCDDCARELSACVCRREDEPMESLYSHLADASNLIGEQMDQVKKDSSAYFRLLEVDHAIDAALTALHRAEEWAQREYDGPDGGDAWSGGFAENH